MIEPPIDNFPDAIRHAALCLWADAVWSGEAMSAFADANDGVGPIEAWGQEITKYPLPPMDDEHIDRCRRALVSTEVAWGRSLSEIAEEIGETLEDLCYSICMQSVGHGVGPGDYPNWPDSLDTRKIARMGENPAHYYLPHEPEEWAKMCLIDEEGTPTDVRQYSGLWGSDKGDGPMFYNFAGDNLSSAEEYDAFLSAIDRQIEVEKAKRTPQGDGNWNGLNRLYNFALWERINRYGRITDPQFSEKAL